jgi:hypothetical protein
MCKVQEATLPLLAVSSTVASQCAAGRAGGLSTEIS